MAKVNLKSRRVWIPGVIVLAFIGIIVVRIVQAGQPQPDEASVEQLRAQRGVPVTAVDVVAGPLEVWREHNGSVSGVNEGVVRARTGDQVSAVPVNVGDRVSRGQVVVRQAGQGTEARVRQAQAARNQAQRMVERLRPLHQAGAISDQEWEGALTQLELASADVAAASDMLSLTSPLAGTVTEVIARPGMIPASGDPLVRIADLSRLVIYLRVSAAQAAELQAGQPARTAVSAEGRVHRVALQADPATRLVEVEVVFPPSAGLIPGTLATVQIGVATRDQAVQVPRAAVRDGSYAWVIGADNRVTRREVTTGLQGREVLEVLSGLQPGDRVVVEGGSFLIDGALVRVVNSGGGGGGGDV
jgi:RND family efflux transporter MFP subunit